MRSVRSGRRARTMTVCLDGREPWPTAARRHFGRPYAAPLSAFRGGRQDFMTVIPAVMTSQDGVQSGAGGICMRHRSTCGDASHRHCWEHSLTPPGRPPPESEPAIRAGCTPTFRARSMSNARRILQIIPPAQTDSRITAAAQLLPGKSRRMAKWRNRARTPAHAPSSRVSAQTQRRFLLSLEFRTLHRSLRESAACLPNASGRRALGWIRPLS